MPTIRWQAKPVQLRVRERHGWHCPWCHVQRSDERLPRLLRWCEAHLRRCVPAHLPDPQEAHAPWLS